MYMLVMYFFFFFSSRRRHTRCSRDWSSDVCSSDLTTSSAGRGGFLWHDRQLELVRPAQQGHNGGRPDAVRREQPVQIVDRSEERRVGKEGRSRGAPYH